MMKIRMTKWWRLSFAQITLDLSDSGPVFSALDDMMMKMMEDDEKVRIIIIIIKLITHIHHHYTHHHHHLHHTHHHQINHHLKMIIILMKMIIPGKKRGQGGQLCSKERAEETFEVWHPWHWSNVRRRGPHTKVNENNNNSDYSGHITIFCTILTNFYSSWNISQETQESWWIWKFDMRKSSCFDLAKRDNNLIDSYHSHFDFCTVVITDM